MRRPAGLGFHASLSVSSRAPLSPRRSLSVADFSSMLLVYVFPYVFLITLLAFLAIYLFRWWICTVTGRCWKRKGLGVTSGRAIPSRWAPALLFLLKAINLARPSWRQLAINFDLPANVRFFCTLGHFRRTGTEHGWPFTSADCLWRGI